MNKNPKAAETHYTGFKYTRSSKQAQTTSNQHTWKVTGLFVEQLRYDPMNGPVYHQKQKKI